MSSAESTSGRKRKKRKKSSKPRKRIIKPNVEELELEEMGIDEAWRPTLQKVFAKDIRVNEWIHELKAAGLLQKHIAKILGISPSNVSQRLRDKIGVMDVAVVDHIRKRKEYREQREIQVGLPYTQHLQKLLNLHGVERTKQERVMGLYVEFTSTYEDPQNFYDLLRSQKIAEKKARLITGQFFDII